MRHGSIDRNDKVEIFNKCRGIGKIVENVRPIDHALAQGALAQLRNGVLAFLQTVEFASRNIKHRRELIEPNTSTPIAAIGIGLMLPRIAGPHETNPQPVVLAKAIAPCAPLVIGHRQVRNLRRYGFDPRLERER